MWSPPRSACGASAVADASSLSASLLALAAMVVAMAALPWGLRRWQQRNQMARGVVQAQIQVLGALAVGPGQRIVTVQVQRNEQTTCLVLGVTAHNIQCLHVLGEAAQSASLTPETITPSAQSATHFAQTLVAEQGKDSLCV